MLLVPNRLVSAGFTVEQATTLFGYLAGMAQPLLMMATIPTISLSASLVPAISAAFAVRDRAEIEKKAAMAVKLCCLITIPASVGMSVLAEPISLLLYGTAKAAAAIAHSGPAICLLGLQQVTTGILQGMGRIKLPMLHMLVGLAVKIAAVWLLTDAAFNIAGAAWATNINFALTAVLNILVLRYYKVCFPWYNIFKIGVAAAFMGGASWYAHGFLAQCFGRGGTVCTLIFAVIVYSLLLPILGIVTRAELAQVPLLKKFIK